MLLPFASNKPQQLVNSTAQLDAGSMRLNNMMDRPGSGLDDYSSPFDADRIPRVKLPPKKQVARKRKYPEYATSQDFLRHAAGEIMRSRLRLQQPAAEEELLGATVKDESLLFAADETPVIKLPGTTPIEEKIDLNDISKYLPVDCYESPLQGWDMEATPTIPVSNSGNKFVELPGEILNLIMAYVFDEQETYEIKWRRGKSLQTHWKYRQKREWLDRHTNYGIEYHMEDVEFPDFPNPQNWTAAYQWTHAFTNLFDTPVLNDPQAIERRLAFRPGFRRHHYPKLKYVSGATAFLMVCHRFHDAGVTAFYSQTKFSFGSVQLFSKFMSNLLPGTLPWLQTLYLCHEVYGHPMWTSMLGVRQRDEHTWKDTCWRAATTLTGLKAVYLLVRLKEVPPDLSLEAPWASAVTAFKEARLDKFELALRSGPDATDRNCAELTACRRRVRDAVLAHKSEAKGGAAKGATSASAKDKPVGQAELNA